MLNIEREGFWGALPEFFAQVAEKTTEIAQWAMGTSEENIQQESESHAKIVKKFMGDEFHRRHSEQITRRTVNAFRHNAGRPGIVDRLHIRKFFKI